MNLIKHSGELRWTGSTIYVNKNIQIILFFKVTLVAIECVNKEWTTLPPTNI